MSHLICFLEDQVALSFVLLAGIGKVTLMCALFDFLIVKKGKVKKVIF